MQRIISNDLHKANLQKDYGKDKEKSRGSKITTNTYFTRLQKAFKLKFALLFCTANQSTNTNLKN